jgi:predicted kinase
MPEIVVMSGIPCSGKSTIVRTMQEISPYTVISRDTIRETAFSRPYVYTNHNETEVTRILDFQFNKYTNWYRDIIIDNTHTEESYLNEWIKRKPEGYTLRIIFLDVPLWKAHIRNVFRYCWTGKWIPLKIMNQMYKNYKKIDKTKYERTY